MSKKEIQYNNIDERRHIELITAINKLKNNHESQNTPEERR